MSHRFTFLVTVEVSRTEGLFESRETLAGAIQEAIENADPGDLSGDNGGSYTVDGWDVEEQEPPPRHRRRK